MANGKSKAIKKVEKPMENALIPLNDTPSWLSNTKQTGLEALGQSDFKIPRIKMLQPLSPEINSFQGKAIPGEFWHTGANISLGSEFKFITCIAGKRVILWNPRDEGGGMLAFSRDGVHWDSGANQEFSVKLKNLKKPVIWKTGKDVNSSGLLMWGSENPDDDESGPAATLSYEYLLYLPDYPELSPVVFGLYRTAITNAKQFNTSLLMLRKPIQSVQVRCFADEKHEGANIWHVANFELQGFTSKENYEAALNIAEKNENYNAEYDQGEVNEVKKESADY